MAEVEIIKPKNNDFNEVSGVFKKKKVCAYARVSTDSDEQLTSYSSQINYYSKKIKANPNWEFVGIYADEGLTGTQIKNRIEFQKMIDDALNDKIDIIITKSISRFARNTLDTLKIVRSLREKNVDVYFEKENIHTLELDSELFLTLYSAFAQGESESISSNVKLGIKAKMKRGEYCGQANPFGYSWNKKTKKLEINENEAPTVELIFELYKNGMGSTNIAKRLNELGLKPRIVEKWDTQKVCRILRNPKYVGDLLGGKYYVVDPISHKKKENFGEHEQYYAKNVHEPIVSRDTWEKVQEIYNMRSKRITPKSKQHGSKFSRKYPLSSKIECACCGASYMRRIGGKRGTGDKAKYVTYWRCGNMVTKKKKCEAETSIRETYIKDAFVQIYNRMIEKKHRTKDQLFSIIKETLIEGNVKDTLQKLNSEKEELETKISHLIDLKLENYNNVHIYDKKEKELSDKLKRVIDNIEYYKKKNNDGNKLELKIKQIQNIFEEELILTEFDDEIFNQLVKKVIIGKYESDGKFNQNVITFILNIGREYSLDLDTTAKKNVSNYGGNIASRSTILC